VSCRRHTDLLGGLAYISGPTIPSRQGQPVRSSQLGDRLYLETIRDNPSGYYRPDLIREDRRRVVGAPTTRSIVEFVDHALTWFDLGDDPPVFSIEGVVAVCGDTCALIHCRVSFGDSVSDFLNAFRTTGSEAEISVLFDLNDRDAALAELDRLYAEDRLGDTGEHAR